MATWYNTGLVAVTNGNAAVTGTSTAWVANVLPGEAFVGPDGRIYEILSVNSNTSITLASNYLGTTQTGQAYNIIPVRGIDRTNQNLLTDLITNYQSVVTGAGAGLFTDGSVTAPAVRFTADQDTGIYRIGANTIGVATGGVYALGINNSQQFGFGEDIIATRVDVRGDIRARSTTGSQIYLGDLNFNGSFALRGPGVGAVLDAGSIYGALGLFAYNGTDARTLRYVVENNGTLRPASDNALPLGTASFRMSTIFAGTGTINTSDTREKEWRGGLSEAEISAGKRMIREIGIYQWLQAIAERGPDEARFHCGVRAQEVIAIMVDEGLDWRRYGWACYDEWEGGDRYGIRPDQLAFWLIAVQAVIQDELDARVAALEAAA